VKDYAPSGYIGVCELGYLSQLFSQGFDQSVLDILLSRGPDPLIPEGHDPTKDEGKWLFLRMCLRDLFKYSHFPISTTMLLAAHCKICLVEVSFQLSALAVHCTRKPVNFNNDEFIALLQFRVLAQRLAHFKDTFHQNMYLEPGSVYFWVVQYITNMGRQGTSGFEFKPNEMLSRSSDAEDLFESVQYQRRMTQWTLKVAEDFNTTRNMPMPEELAAAQAKMG